MNMQNLEVAIVLPAYREATRLNGDPFRANLTSIAESFSNEYPGRFLGIVVDDGSNDGTAELAIENGWHVYSHTHNMGKGAAIRSGVREVMAKYTDYSNLTIAFADADGQYSTQSIQQLISSVQEGADIAIAKRILSSSLEELRHPIKVAKSISSGDHSINWRDIAHPIAQRLFNFIAPTGATDPLAGAMAFNQSIFNIWVNQSKTNGYATPAEVLHIAYKHGGLKIFEEPTTITAVGDSRVKLIDSAKLIRDAIRIRRNRKIS
ncbi:MAG: glycosyltransferase family 2 protein [Firmicutes bacterium]|nr:glycosyltransferase family 2 protein [Bacillota bacterium]